MLESYFIHNTPSAKIKINIKVLNISTKELIQFQNKNYFDSLCKKGCPNFKRKWSCPPYSPTFSEYSKEYTNCILVLLYCDLNQFNYIKTEYMKVKASNSILKSRLDSLMRMLENTYTGLMISNGSCRLCKPCACKKQLPCKKPDLRRYSMESLGLNVSHISKTYFNHELLWYKNKTAPKYSSVLSCLITNNALSKDNLSMGNFRNC